MKKNQRKTCTLIEEGKSATRYASHPDKSQSAGQVSAPIRRDRQSSLSARLCAAHQEFAIAVAWRIRNRQRGLMLFSSNNFAPPEDAPRFSQLVTPAAINKGVFEIS